MIKQPISRPSFSPTPPLSTT